MALVGSDAAQERGLTVYSEVEADSPIEAIEPETFVYPAQNAPTEFMRSFAQEAETATHKQSRGCKRAA